MAQAITHGWERRLLSERRASCAERTVEEPIPELALQHQTPDFSDTWFQRAFTGMFGRHAMKALYMPWLGAMHPAL
jgi:hypothetical protein